MPQRFDFRAFTLSLKDSQHRFIGMFCCLVIVADESDELVYESARDVKLPLRMTLRWESREEQLNPVHPRSIWWCVVSLLGWSG